MIMNKALNYVLDHPQLVLFVGGPILAIIFGIGLYRTRSRPGPSSSAPQQAAEIPASVLLAWLLILGGACCAGYFFLFFDTSLALPQESASFFGVSRVN